MPPATQTPNVSQNGKPCQCPIITSPGRMKITDDSVPAAEACVCTMLFSRMFVPPMARSTAIEITAAGIADENVRPTFRPRYTFDAVKITVMTAPRSMPRSVSSGSVAAGRCLGDGRIACCERLLFVGEGGGDYRKVFGCW